MQVKNSLVACFTDIHSVGGGSTLAKNVGTGLSGRGHHTSFLSLRAGLQSDASSEADGVSVRYFSLDAGRAWRVPQLVRGRQVRRVLASQTNRPDTLLAISPFFIPPARKLWPETRIIYLFPCLLWHCVPKTWERKPRLPLRLNHWLLGREERRAFDAADAVIVQAQSVVQDVIDFHRPAGSKLVVAPTGVRDLTREVRSPRKQLRKELATPDDAVVALAVGHLDANKNVTHLLNAVHRTNNAKLWLWVVGDGPLAARLQDEAGAGPASSRIRLLGVRNDMPDVYAAADLLVHSAWYDNFPNVYLEAMVSGLPIVGPRGDFPRVVSPLDELICEGIHGHTYRLDALDELVGILSNLANQPERIEKMGSAARQRALQKFSWTRYIDAVERAMLEG